MHMHMHMHAINSQVHTSQWCRQGGGGEGGQPPNIVMTKQQCL